MIQVHLIEGDLETRIQGKLGILVSLVDADEVIKLPGDYADQYRDWRPAEQVQLFEDCNETVYATGTVNIRASYTADSEKLGSLNKGDSVTRTGTSIAGTEAEGWSRIQLSDGNVVYVSNKYISTTKPVVQQQQQTSESSGGSITTQPQTGGTQQQAPPSSYEDDLTPEQAAEARRKAEEAFLNNGGTIITDQREGQISASEEEYIGTILNGGGAQYNP